LIEARAIEAPTDRIAALHQVTDAIRDLAGGRVDGDGALLPMPRCNSEHLAYADARLSSAEGPGLGARTPPKAAAWCRACRA